MDMRRRLILTTMSDRTSSQSHAVPSLQNPLGIVESGCLHSKRLLLSVSEMFFIFFQLLFARPDADFSRTSWFSACSISTILNNIATLATFRKSSFRIHFQDLHDTYVFALNETQSLQRHCCTLCTKWNTVILKTLFELLKTSVLYFEVFFVLVEHILEVKL